MIKFTASTPDEVVSTLTDAMHSHLYEADNVQASLEDRKEAFKDLLEFISKQAKEIAENLE